MRELKGKKGFTLIELLVVIAIIAILAAIAIPQYNKYRANAMLSNVQQLAKSVAVQAIAVATTAGQNPQCRSENVFYVTWDEPPYLKARITSTDGYVCDKVKLYKDKPDWVDSISVNNLTLTIEGNDVDFDSGVITVTSKYSIGGGKSLGCKYYPDNDTMTDADDNHVCDLGE